MFAYCGNNPVNRIDTTGNFWNDVGQFFNNLWNGICDWAANTFGAGCSTSTTVYETETPIIPEPLPITAKAGTSTTVTVTQHGDSTKPISVYANGDLDDPIGSSTAGLCFNSSDATLDISVGLDDIGVYFSTMNTNVTNSVGLRLNLQELKLGIETSTAITWDAMTETAYTNVSINGGIIAAAYYFITAGQYQYQQQAASAY
jgi:hypothetical protein